METRELTLLTDLYELTMMQGYCIENRHELAVFDVFYRTNPSGSSFSIAGGLEQVVDYINNINFSEKDLSYLSGLNLFQESFIDYLRHFKFTGDIFSVPEGTVIFPNEPILKVIAPISEAQFIETAILNILNHQSLIATKSARINWAAGEDKVLEFGLRRAQGPDAGVYGARAAIIGGCFATSNVLAGQMFSVPVSGTHAHSWVMSFPDEYTAFKKYANAFPDAALLLVDTYDTLKSGVPNAIKVFKEMFDAGITPKLYGIRLDSGDLAYLSKKARKMLDNAGFQTAVISASSDLDEYLIQSLKSQGSEITVWGVGTNLITSKDCPAFGGVYKLSAIQNKDGVFEPKIKISESHEKITNPGNKKIIRVYDKISGKIKADLIALDHETFSEDASLLLFDPDATWKKMRLQPGTFTLRELLIPIFKSGHLVYDLPVTMDIKKYCETEIESLWPENRRLHNPQTVYVDLSKVLYDLKHELLNADNLD